MRTILVTGASGIVGRRVVPRLAADGHAVIAAVREGRSAPEGSLEVRAIGNIGPSSDWTAALEGVDTLVHLAGRTPGRGVEAAELDRVNSLGTKRLVQQAGEAGVRLAVFVSSVFAVVDSSWPDVVDENTPPSPSTSYGRSKLAAETHVRDFAAAAGRSAIILRPPLVHAPDAKGNWRLLHLLAASGMPLPFGSVSNRRSTISADNLSEAIATVIGTVGTRPVDGTYMVADDPALSTRDIIRHMRAGMGRASGLVPLPLSLMALLLRAAGKTGMADSLFGNLVVDSTLFHETFGWWPTTDSAAEIERTAKAFAARG